MNDVKVPEGWELRNLADLCFFQEGPGLRNWQYRASGFPFINIRCIREGFLDLTNVQYISQDEANERYQHFFLNEGDYVLSSSGTLGRMAKVRKSDLPLMLNTSVIRFRSIDENLLWQDFLPHYLQSPDFVEQITEESQGSAQVNFGPTHLKLVRSYFPPFSEQQKIATILTSVDTVIEKTRAQIDKLKHLKTAMMQELLTKGIGHTEFKDSPVGKIPKEWEVKLLTEVSKNLDAKRVPIKSTDRSNMKGSYRYYGASGVIDYVNDFLFDGSYILLGEDGENVLSRNLPLAFIVTGKFWVNNHAHVLQARENINLAFLCEYLESLNYTNIASGSAQPKITQSALSNILVPLPPLDEQQRISEVLQSIDKKIVGKNKKLASLGKTKKALMQDLLTGKVRVVLS